MSETLEQLEHLLSRSVLGDKAAYTALYDATSPRVYAMLMNMLRNPTLAQDILQETYVKVWARAEDYRPERGQVLSWIVGIARYQALDTLRAQGRREKWEAQGGESVAPTVITSDPLSDLLQECFAQLADIQRRSIFSAFVEGFTHEELAHREDTPVGTVKSRIRRGLKRLRDCMER